MRPISRRRFIGLSSSAASFLSMGCGTVLHPERRGQPAGPLDWEIVALDAIGLILFLVPGVIAFAVDFNNSTIYLPPDYHGQKNSNGDGKRLVEVSVPGEKMTVRKVEELVSKQAKRDIHLRPGAYQTEELESIDEFWVTADKLAAL